MFVRFAVARSFDREEISCAGSSPGIKISFAYESASAQQGRVAPHDSEEEAQPF
jgi:hypothetical protein